MLNSSSRRYAFFTTVTLVTVFVGTASAQTQVTKAFKISGEGVAPQGLPLPGQPARPHWILGTATHLGLYHGEGSVQTDTNNFVAHADGRFTGEFGSGDDGFNFAAANGDLLATDYGRIDRGADQPGTFTITILDVLGVTDEGDPILLVEAEFVAEFVVDPNESTGRFEGISGSWIMYAHTEPFVLGSSQPIDYGWEGEGELTFQEGE